VSIVEQNAVNRRTTVDVDIVFTIETPFDPDQLNSSEAETMVRTVLKQVYGIKFSAGSLDTITVVDYPS